MRRADYFRQGSRGWLRLHEKGGKRHDVPAHHRAAEALDDYLRAAGLGDAKASLFQSVDPAGRRLTGRALARRVGAGDDQAARRCRGAPAIDLLPHVSGDGDHGVSVERGDARARAADRGAHVAEDDEALRSDGGRGLARRDRAHRHLRSPRGRRGGPPGTRGPREILPARGGPCGLDSENGHSVKDRSGLHPAVRAAFFLFVSAHSGPRWPMTSISSATTVTESSSSTVSSIGAKSGLVGSSVIRTCRHPSASVVLSLR